MSESLRDVLQPIIRAELATIAALDRVTQHTDDPGYVILYHSAKTTKQASVEQMLVQLRAAGEEPSEHAGALGAVMQLQTLLLQKVGTSAAIAAMRLVEEEIVVRYRDAYDAQTGAAKDALRRPYHRAVTRWVVLMAHVAQRREGDSSLVEKLPLPLGAYFASGEDRVCMRCLLDRPGADPALGALERSRPRPTQYICAACHAEVLSHFPPDLLAQADRWPIATREDRVIERSLSRPEKLLAERDVLARMSGLEPDVPAPAATRAAESPPVTTPGARAAQPPSRLDLPREGASDLELAYTDLLFDFRSVRANW